MIGVTEGMVYKYYKMDNVDSQTIEKWANILRIPIMTFLDDNTTKLHVGAMSLDIQWSPKYLLNVLSVCFFLFQSYINSYNLTVFKEVFQVDILPTFNGNDCSKVHTLFPDIILGQSLFFANLTHLFR